MPPAAYRPQIQGCGAISTLWAGEDLARLKRVLRRNIFRQAVAIEDDAYLDMSTETGMPPSSETPRTFNGSGAPSSTYGLEIR